MTRNGALLDYGFRPFFLFAGIYAVFAMFAWLAWLALHSLGAAVLSEKLYLPAIQWHGHEMLYGYATAVIAGFLLTATPNWTNLPPVSGGRLLVLLSLWMLGRLAMWASAYLPGWAVAAADLVFLPALITFVAIALWRAKAGRNFVVVFVLLLLVAANAIIHLGALDMGGGSVELGLAVAANTAALLLTIIGGRIVPAFTGNALKESAPDATIRQVAWLDRLSIASVALIIPLDIAFPSTIWTGAVVATAAALNAARLSRWQGHRTLGQPILWVLHLGYLWLVIYLVGKAAALLLGWPAPSTALHALTVGAIGTLTLGVMTRAALGHTGRALVAHPATVMAYFLVSLAAIVRVAGVMVYPDGYADVMIVSGSLWTAAFVLFLGIYAPILIGPRADGKP